MSWLDRLLGRVTMYALVALALGALAIIALALGTLGVIGIPPVAMLASAAVALAVTVGSGWLLTRLVRGTPHLISSVITGLLIFFIMQPTLDPLGLAGIALAGLVATASKLLIAARRRHVLNPAAAGTFVVGVVVFAGGPALGFPSWWVGSAALLAPVAVAAFLVLYRTQKLLLGGVFIGAASALAFAGGLARGGDPAAVLGFAVLASPAVFLGGFMLTEPLTLPPRRWQQLAEAVLVAVLMTTPFSLLPGVSNTPQLALLVGNVLAFLVGQRRAIRLTYLGKQSLGPTTWELSFQPQRGVRFRPGQYMELSLPHRRADFRGSRRYFSIASAPTDDGPITFAITVPPRTSSFKRALLELEPGALVTGTSVGGDFVLPRDTREPLLLIAGGIGITPFASQLGHALERGEQRDITLVYTTNSPGEVPYAGLLAASGARVVLFSPDAPDPLPPNWVYGGPQRVSSDQLDETVPDAARRRTFISGPPALVSDLRRAARTMGVRRIHTDAFSGY